MKTGIVCEGGGMRGVFTAGVLQAFMDNNFVADELVGVSAGASNGASYVSGQNGRGYRTNVDYAGDKRYASWESYRKTKSFFGMDFIFGTIPEELDVFDYDAFYASPTAYFAGATDVHTGKATWFGQADVQPGLAVLRASCSMPVLSPIVEIGGGQYLDGGVAAPVPLEKALADGCERLLVILTRPRGYQKKPQSFRPLYRAMYRKYPQMVKAIDVRHLVYNHALQKLWRLEATGNAIVIAPPEDLPADRMGKDKEKLIASYNIGYACGEDALRFL